MFTRSTRLLRAGVSARVGVRSDRRGRFVRRRLHGLPRAHRTTSSEANLRRAMVHGSAMGSFVVEGFSVDAPARGRRRRTSSGASREFHELVAFEQDARAMSGTRRRSTIAPPGVDIDAADDAKHRIAKLVESTFTAGTRGAFGGFGGMFRVPERREAAAARLERRRRRHQDQGRDRGRPPRHRGARPREPLRERHPRAGRGAAVLPRLRRVRRARAGDGRGGRRGRRRGVPRERLRAAWAARRPRCPGCTRRRTTTWRASSSATWRRIACSAPARVREGDVLVGLASSGLHTNGYSLARRIVRADGAGLRRPVPRVDGESVADMLLRRAPLVPRGCCAPCSADVHAMAHITGGGLPGNLNRVLPPALDAVVDTASWELPNLFRVLAEAGGGGAPTRCFARSTWASEWL